MKLFLSIGIMLISQLAFAQLKLNRLFSDHAVLQRQKPIPVWGSSKPNERVTVDFAGQTQSGQADANGNWRIVFSAREAGGPFNLLVRTSEENLSVKDILIGEVWLCSGQSNMEWIVANSDNYINEKKDADYPQIRQFYVEHEVTLQPLKELKNGRWTLCSPDSFGNFTAVGFFFAKEIYKKLNVPIGLVHSSWGGSQIEGWISKESMAGSDELKENAKVLPTTWNEADAQLERTIKKQLLGNADAQISLDDEAKYIKPDYDFSKWLTADPLGQWDWKGIWAWRGNGYMAKTIEIPNEIIGKVSTLGLPECYSYNEVYINGLRVYAGLQKGAKQILIDANTWKPGTNKIVLKLNRVIDPDWFGVGLTGSKDELFVKSDAKKINIHDGDWKLMPALAEPHTFAHSSNNVGTTIYNAMIAPLAPFSMRGALWYQGETNAGRAYQYRKTFPLMIQDWRKKWNDDFDFYFVQLATYGKFQNSNEGSNWAELREAQTMTLKLPKTGMAVTTDIGNPKDIHPTNKQDVGKRLAATALKNSYGQNVLASGPIYKSVAFGNNYAEISFDNTGSGLMVKDKYGYVKNFEIAGDDKVFYYAKAEIKDNKVFVYHPKGVKPIAVRYAWADAPEDANLFNNEGFPASPFRTDDWKGITEGNKF